MKQKNIKSELTSFHNKFESSTDIDKYWNVLGDYTLFVCRERSYIPKILRQAYYDGILSLDDLVRLHIADFAYRGERGLKLYHVPRFVNREFQENTDIFDELCIRLKKELKIMKRDGQVGPYLKRKSFLYDFEKISNLLNTAFGISDSEEH